jgi:hypothetical protein
MDLASFLQSFRTRLEALELNDCPQVLRELITELMKGLGVDDKNDSVRPIEPALRCSEFAEALHIANVILGLIAELHSRVTSDSPDLELESNEPEGGEDELSPELGGEDLQTALDRLMDQVDDLLVRAGAVPFIEGSSSFLAVAYSHGAEHKFTLRENTDLSAVELLRDGEVVATFPHPSI